MNPEPRTGLPSDEHVATLTELVRDMEGPEREAVIQVAGAESWGQVAAGTTKTLVHALAARSEASPDSLAELRALSDAATPGPWTALTHGTASVHEAMGYAAGSIAATRIPDAPEVHLTDLSWIDLEDGRHVALIGNGPKGPDNSKFIVAAVNYVRRLIADKGLG